MVQLCALLPTVYTVATVIKVVGQQHLANKKNKNVNSLFMKFVMSISRAIGKKDLTLDKTEPYNRDVV